MSVCPQTPPRPMDGFTSYLVERCTSYPEYTWTTFRDPGSKVKVTMEVKVTAANTLKNQLCATYSSDSSFWRSWRVEQILYRNLWSTINIFHKNGVFRISTVRLKVDFVLSKRMTSLNTVSKRILKGHRLCIYLGCYRYINYKLISRYWKLDLL